MYKEDYKYSLTKAEETEVINLFNSFDFISINQFPRWESINNPNKKTCYYVLKDEEKLICYCTILESHKIAYVSYGPVSHKKENIVVAINSIRNYYKNNGFLKVIVKLGDTGIIGKEILEHFKESYTLEKHPYNWSTLRINLNNNIENIYKNIRSNHKQSIKKASKLGAYVKPISDKDGIRKLADIFDQMYSNRKLVKSFNNTYNVFSNIFDFFEAHKNGWILGVYLEEKLIGGLILPIQGKTVYYQYGMTSSEYRKVPILHLGLFEAIKKAKDNQYSFFDFGGYMPDIEKTDQIYHINKFKKWFGGELLYYPKNMHFVLSPFKFKIYSLLKKLYFKIRR